MPTDMQSITTSVGSLRRYVMTITAIAPPITAPQIDEAAASRSGTRATRSSLEELVVGDHVVQPRADDAPDHDPERDVVDAVAGVAPPAPPLLGDVHADEHTDGEDDAVHVEGPEVPVRRAGDRAEQHRPIIVGRRPVPSCFKEFAPGCRYHRMRRGLLLLVTSVAGTVVGAVVLAACLPATPAPSPTTHHRGGARRPPRPRRPPTTTTTRPASGAGPRTGRSGRARCSPPTTRGTATCRRFPPTPTRPTTSPPSPASAATRSCTPTSVVPASTASRTSPCRATRRSVPIDFTDYGDESDPGPYPIPTSAPVESGSDAHVLAVDRDHCKLYELFGASPRCESLVGGVGRGVRPHVERAASGGVDVGRRRRAADLPRPGALRRGGERSHRPRAALHRVAQPARRTCTRRRTGRRRRPTRTCRRWDCASG